MSAQHKVYIPNICGIAENKAVRTMAEHYLITVGVHKIRIESVGLACKPLLLRIVGKGIVQ